MSCPARRGESSHEEPSVEEPSDEDSSDEERSAPVAAAPHFRQVLHPSRTMFQPVPATQKSSDKPASATSEKPATERALTRSEEVERTRALVREVLTDVKANATVIDKSGKNSSLYGFEALRPFERLGHGLPTLRAEGAFERAKDADEFRSRLVASDEFMATLPIKSLGMVMAGGAVAAHLMHERDDEARIHFDDWDLFLVGHDEASAKKAIDRLGELLLEDEDNETVRRRDGAHDDDRPLMVYRTQGCVTFRSVRRQRKVQVILRLYNAVSEVLHGFDLGSSAVAWDGERVWLTKAGLLAASHGANVLNLVARRTSYEHRLSKYFSRGYDLVLPGLNRQTLADLDNELPFLNLYFSRSEDTPDCCACHMACTKMDPRRDGAAPAPGEGGYTANIPYGDLKAIRRRNHREGLRESPCLSALCAYSEYRKGLRLSTLQPEYPTVEDLRCEVVQNSLGGNLKLKPLRTLLGFEGAKEFVAHVAASPDIQWFWGDLAEKSIEAAIRGRQDLTRRVPYDIPSAALYAPKAGPGTTKREWYGKAYSESSQKLVKKDKSPWWSSSKKVWKLAANEH